MDITQFAGNGGAEVEASGVFVAERRGFDLDSQPQDGRAEDKRQGRDKQLAYLAVWGDDGRALGGVIGHDEPQRSRAIHDVKTARGLLAPTLSVLVADVFVDPSSASEAAAGVAVCYASRTDVGEMPLTRPTLVGDSVSCTNEVAGKSRAFVAENSAFDAGLLVCPVRGFTPGEQSAAAWSGKHQLFAGAKKQSGTRRTTTRNGASRRIVTLVQIIADRIAVKNWHPRIESKQSTHRASPRSRRGEVAGVDSAAAMAACSRLSDPSVAPTGVGFFSDTFQRLNVVGWRFAR